MFDWPRIESEPTLSTCSREPECSLPPAAAAEIVMAPRMGDPWAV